MKCLAPLLALLLGVLPANAQSTSTWLNNNASAFTSAQTSANAAAALAAQAQAAVNAETARAIAAESAFSIATKGATGATGPAGPTGPQGPTGPAGAAATNPGTVTSVGVTAPSDETVIGSPITGAGTIAITRNTQPANAVLAGPTSGLNAAPGYRQLTTSDLPSSGVADGCVRMSLSSSTALAISPYGCNTLVIGGVPRIITATTFTSTVSASTFYYAYASWSGTAVTYSLSTTGHITGSDGREYLSSGGSTPTAVTTSRLIGAAYVDTNSHFNDNSNTRGLLSYFNRISKPLVLAAPASIATGATVITPIFNGPFFIAWADDAVHMHLDGYVFNNTANYTTISYLTSDNTQVSYGQQIGEVYDSIANTATVLSNNVDFFVTEGALHFSQLDGYVTGGVGVWVPSIGGMIRG